MVGDAMGSIVDLAGWREEHEPELLRLERAVQSLDETFAGYDREDVPAWLVTEVLAIQGCISMELVSEAADRAERLVERWRRRASGEGT
jgi:hypothetical protein